MLHVIIVRVSIILQEVGCFFVCFLEFLFFFMENMKSVCVCGGGGGGGGWSTDS